MKQNLLSYSRITKKNKIVSYDNISKIYNQNRELIAIAQKKNNLYYMKSYIKNYNQSREVNSSVIKNENNGRMSLKEKWHRILGHVNFNYLNILCKNELFTGFAKRSRNRIYEMCNMYRK